jgi:hypothetical protein
VPTGRSAVLVHRTDLAVLNRHQAACRTGIDVDVELSRESPQLPVDSVDPIGRDLGQQADVFIDPAGLTEQAPSLARPQRKDAAVPVRDGQPSNRRAPRGR